MSIEFYYFIVPVLALVMIGFCTAVSIRGRSRPRAAQQDPPDPESLRLEARIRPVITEEDVDRYFPALEYGLWKATATATATRTAATETPNTAGAPSPRKSHDEQGRPNDDVPRPDAAPESAEASAGAAPVIDDTRDQCAVCIEYFDEEDCIRALVCGHIFHTLCVDSWLTKRRACCPLCKMDYFGLGANVQVDDPVMIPSAVPTQPPAVVVRGADQP
ncbi:E3 ubiquitin-protein ligase RNF103 [Aspergillus candidus]|uniref:RING-type domain-containing protein n=1 Tax=Aspergillus candidus TaxID=41067 RepID=A0A2I2F0T1_ASPCN|nr:hypothetical protein BDW47DRAFT_120535 [Aspergillus candidus]PLB34244.1 hypothetical protein BDW47DRAFT_120535 [Aspergillus candidus]